MYSTAMPSDHARVYDTMQGVLMPHELEWLHSWDHRPTAVVMVSAWVLLLVLPHAVAGSRTFLLCKMLASGSMTCLLH